MQTLVSIPRWQSRLSAPFGAGQLQALLFCTLVAAFSQIPGWGFLLFPELAALSSNVLRDPAGPWASRPWQLIALPVLTGCLGVLITRHIADPSVAVLLAVAAAKLVLWLARSPLVPAISAAALPVILQIHSWAYPAQIGIGLVALAGLLRLWQQGQGACVECTAASSARSVDMVVVTGAGGGIGREIAIVMAKAGAKVIVADIGASLSGSGGSTSPAEQTKALIEQSGGVAQICTESVAAWGSAQKIVQSCLDHFGKIDAVVNNAGILRDGIFHRMTEDDWMSVVNVHLNGSFYVSRAAAEHYRKQESGAFVHITSTSGLIGNIGQANYAAAKLAITALSKSIALDMARYNVRSNCLGPWAWSRDRVLNSPATTMRSQRPGPRRHRHSHRDGECRHEKASHRTEQGRDPRGERVHPVPPSRGGRVDHGLTVTAGVGGAGARTTTDSAAASASRAVSTSAPKAASSRTARSPPSTSVRPRYLAR